MQAAEALDASHQNAPLLRQGDEADIGRTVCPATSGVLPEFQSRIVQTYHDIRIRIESGTTDDIICNIAFADFFGFKPEKLHTDGETLTLPAAYLFASL